MRQGDYFQTSFYFLKKLYISQKQVVSTSVFERTFAIIMKTNFITFQTVDLDICSILIFL